MRREIDCLDNRVLSTIRNPRNKLDLFKEILSKKNVYLKEDPEDVSILPRVISKQEHIHIKEVCRELTETAFSYLSKVIKGEITPHSSKINDFILHMPIKKPVLLSGNARYDFLKENINYKLVEMNFVNVGAMIESTESCNSLMTLFPSLSDHFYYESPPKHIKKRFRERKAKNILLLTRDDYSDQISDSFDRVYLKNKLRPLNVKIVPEREYSKIRFKDGKAEYEGELVDSFYLKHLDGTKGENDPLFRNRDFCSNMLNSKSFIFDNLITMLLEDKDLRFLLEVNPKVRSYIPKIIDLENADRIYNYSRYVLKKRDTHCGEGVIISPRFIPKNMGLDLILQQKVYANLFPVLSIEGKEGYAIFDTGVYVSYSYDLAHERLLKFNVSGYLTRFSLEKEIVNLSQGGGLIPTLIEK
ncbi:MAG: hypothetical protein QXJ28_01355 [Candidatus Pacearchaeota archaeon]